jgi:hypothetical protein
LALSFSWSWLEQVLHYIYRKVAKDQPSASADYQHNQQRRFVGTHVKSIKSSSVKSRYSILPAFHFSINTVFLLTIFWHVSFFESQIPGANSANAWRIL